MTKTATKEIVIAPEKDITGTDPQALMMAAVQAGGNIEVLERIMQLRKAFMEELAMNEYRAGMSRLQQGTPIIVKSNGVDYTSRAGKRVQYQYASLDVIVAQVKDIIAENGFSYDFTTQQENGSVTAICNVHHAAGHSESTAFTIPVDPDAYMNAAQKVASALTYAKRYAFCNAFGIMTGEEDNDTVHDDPLAKTEPVKKQAPTKAKGNLDEALKFILQSTPSQIKAIGNQIERRSWTDEELKQLYHAVDARRQALKGGDDI